MNSNLFVQFTADGRAISFSVDWNESAEKHVSVNLCHSRCWRVSLCWSCWAGKSAITAKVVGRMTASCTNSAENTERHHKSEKNGRFLNKRHRWPKPLSKCCFGRICQILTSKSAIKKGLLLIQICIQIAPHNNELTSPAQFSKW